MQSSDAETRTSRLDDLRTVVHLLIKDPVREAVREALAEERELGTTARSDLRESADADATTESAGGERRRVGALTLLLGLVAVSYLARRRDRVIETVPSRVTRRFEGESEAETEADDESGAETGDHDDDADDTGSAGSDTEPVASAELD